MDKLKQALRQWLGIGKVKKNVETVMRETPRKTGDAVSAPLEEFLKSGYDFRFNVLTEQAEMCRKGETMFRPVNQRMTNTLCLDARDRGINCWDKDVTRLLNSERMADFHPFLTYMATLPVWDGIDRVTPLALRVASAEHWVKGFHK